MPGRWTWRPWNGRQPTGKNREIGRAIAGGDLGGGVETTAHAVFVDSFGSVMVVCTVVCAVGALIAYTLIRSSNLHEPAADGMWRGKKQEWPNSAGDHVD